MSEKATVKAERWHATPVANSYVIKDDNGRELMQILPCDYNKCTEFSVRVSKVIISGNAHDEMLAALKEAEAYAQDDYNEWKTDDYEPECKGLLVKLRAAIAKAEPE